MNFERIQEKKIKYEQNKSKIIPDSCPSCKEKYGWKEVVNPFTTGIPVGKSFRIGFISVRGIFSKVIKDKLGFNQVKYRCKNCGFEEIYELPN